MSKCVNCGNEILTGDIHWEMGLCNNCHNELYKKTSYVDLLNREMDGLLDDYAKRRIADLEAKLAQAKMNESFEKEKKDNAFKFIEELKQQLAEKDEQINMLEEHKFYADNIIQAYADKCKNSNQDKISFCIEQLEKVIKFINEKYQYLLELEKQGNLTEHGKGSKLTSEIVLQKIDNQIKQLKESK